MTLGVKNPLFLSYQDNIKKEYELCNTAVMMR